MSASKPLTDTLKKFLADGQVVVTFNKKDGTERTMRCTTNEAVIPRDMLPKGTGRAVNGDVQVVFDLDLNQWRSFRLDSVIQWDNVTH